MMDYVENNSNLHGNRGWEPSKAFGFTTKGTLFITSHDLILQPQLSAVSDLVNKVT